MFDGTILNHKDQKVTPMIIACPQCATRFVVPSTIFAKGGRKVRCASCGHMWFEDGSNKQEDEASGVAKGNFADDLLRADGHHHEGGKPDSNENGKKSSWLKSDFTKGFKVVAAACVSVLFAFFAYEFFKPSLIQGEGLAFNEMHIERTEHGIILTGEVVNTVNDERGMPSLKVTFLMPEGMEGDSTLISLDKAVLTGGETYPLSVTIDDVPHEVQNLKVTFAGGEGDVSASISQGTHDNSHNGETRPSDEDNKATDMPDHDAHGNEHGTAAETSGSSHDDGSGHH